MAGSAAGLREHILHFCSAPRWNVKERTLKTVRIVAILFAVLVMLAPGGWAQERPRPPEEPKTVTPLKVQVVFSEFDGEKKISSLPYTFFANADDRVGRVSTNLRMGIRVPVMSQGNPPQAQYLDVGTDIDCHARTAEAGRFKLDLSVRRSSLYSSGPEKKSLDWSPGDAPLSAQPIIRQFSVSLNLLARDGETVQSTVATDPVSGRVLKIDVTPTVVK